MTEAHALGGEWWETRLESQTRDHEIQGFRALWRSLDFVAPPSRTPWSIWSIRGGTFTFVPWRLQTRVISVFSEIDRDVWNDTKILILCYSNSTHQTTLHTSSPQFGLGAGSNWFLHRKEAPMHFYLQLSDILTEAVLRNNVFWWQRLWDYRWLEHWEKNLPRGHNNLDPTLRFLNKSWPIPFIKPLVPEIRLFLLGLKYLMPFVKIVGYTL